ncbi:MAG: hypothetical protein IKX50_09730 [Spirochaetia bacterium]|nr:hypothetical protein [Spirochaetia bacterium]
MKTKKIIIILLALCLVFFMAGCDSGGSSSGGNGGGGNGGGGGGGGTDAVSSPLCFTANAASTIQLYTTTGAAPSLEYSTDGSTWLAFNMNQDYNLASGSKFYLRGNNATFNTMAANATFVMTGSIAASGNIMSLVDKTCASTTIPNDYCFGGLFWGCEVMTTPPELPATTLTKDCYMDMFYDCTALTVAPELPATTLLQDSYMSMFQGCTAMTSIVIKATTLAKGSLSDMLANCSSLNSITVHFSAWDPADFSESPWVVGVAATGTFKCPSVLPATYDTDHIPDGWTKTDL